MKKLRNGSSITKALKSLETDSEFLRVVETFFQITPAEFIRLVRKFAKTLKWQEKVVKEPDSGKSAKRPDDSFHGSSQSNKQNAKST